MRDLGGIELQFFVDVVDFYIQIQVEDLFCLNIWGEDRLVY